MGAALSEVLPYAIGVAISPIPIIAIILVLFSDRARVNGPAFLLGWIIGVAGVTFIVYLLADAGDIATDDDTSDTMYWVRLALGMILVLLAARRWRSRPAADEPGKEPKWMSALDTLTPVKAIGLAILLSALNPKNLVLSVAAGVNVAQTGASTGDSVVALIVFVVLASAATGTALVLYLVGGDRTTDTLNGWKTWLSSHNAAVVAVLLLVFGVFLLSQGIRGLTA